MTVLHVSPRTWREYQRELRWRLFARVIGAVVAGMLVAMSAFGLIWLVLP